MPYPGLNERLSAALEGLDAELGGLEILNVRAESDGLYLDIIRAGQPLMVRVSHPRRGVVDEHWLAQVRAALIAAG